WRPTGGPAGRRDARRAASCRPLRPPVAAGQDGHGRPATRQAPRPAPRDPDAPGSGGWWPRRAPPRALLHLDDPRQAEAGPTVFGSDRQGEVVERDGQPLAGRHLDRQLIVASPGVL